MSRKYKRPLLRHPETLDIITVQHKAWNDAVGMTMHLKYQLQPWKVRHAPHDKCLMVVDNVAFHHVKEVVEAFAAAEWVIKFFPPNMTDELQPMDLIVNAVLKCEMRKLRIALVFESLQAYRQLLLQWSVASVDNRDLPKPVFDPPKPNYKDAVKTMLEVHRVHLASPQFIASLTACFKKVGLIPDAGTYKKYRAVKLGEIKKEKGLTTNDCVAGWYIDLTTRRDGEMDKESDEAEVVPPRVPTAPLQEAQVPVVVTINSDSDDSSDSGKESDRGAVCSDSEGEGKFDEDAVLDRIHEEEAPPETATKVAELVAKAAVSEPVLAKRIRKIYDRNAAWEK